MKIGILGARGIPNRYGGFEQFAGYLSAGLAERGHEVWVYSPHHHDYQQSMYGQVHIIHRVDPEPRIGTTGQFIYDFNCIRDSRNRGFDILLLLGYTSSSVWSKWLPKNAVIISNLDGLEWKRAKYTVPVKRFLRVAEKWAVKRSDYLVADSPGIQDYLEKKYNVQSSYIPYAAGIFTIPNKQIPASFNLSPFNYDLIVARMEPENNPEMILQGFLKAAVDHPLVVIGSVKMKYGRKLQRLFGQRHILFLGAIYDLEILDNLRHFSRLYFHGHSVGGTNPSLLEAMGSGALIAAHDNPFNRYVLGDNGFFFKTSDDIKALIKGVKRDQYQIFIKNNYERIGKQYALDKVIDAYEKLMVKALHKNHPFQKSNKDD